jgi:hypothetical protein
MERISREAASRTEERFSDRSEAATDHHEFGVEDGDQIGDPSAEFGANFGNEAASDLVTGVRRRRHVLAPDGAGLEAMGERTLRVETDDLSSQTYERRP